MIPVSLELPLDVTSIPLLHGTGGSAYDELFIFGGIGAIIVVLGYLSWRASREKDRRRRRRHRGPKAKR